MKKPEEKEMDVKTHDEIADRADERRERDMIEHGTGNYRDARLAEAADREYQSHR